MQVRDGEGNVVDPNPTAEILITGEESQNLHLNTVEDVDCVHCYDEVFFGQPVDQVSLKNKGFIHLCPSAFFQAPFYKEGMTAIIL